MLLDGETGEHSRPSRKGYAPSKLARTLSVVVTVTLVGCVAVAAKHHGSPQTPTTSIPQTLLNPNAPPPSESWALKFNATFLGSQLDTRVWTTCYTWATNGCTNYGNASEKEWYLASQDQVSGGELHLVAQRSPTPGFSKSGAPKQYECRSGIVTSFRGLNFEYGYLQIIAEIPFGKGLWPALWLGGTNQKWPPEIDIFEHWNSLAYAKVYLHPLTGVRQGGVVTEPGLGTGWHTFGLYWTPARLIWYYDGHPVFATSTGVPHQDMFLLMNVADDINGPGTCSGSMRIRSVRLWQQPS